MKVAFNLDGDLAAVVTQQRIRLNFAMAPIGVRDGMFGYLGHITDSARWVTPELTGLLAHAHNILWRGTLSSCWRVLQVTLGVAVEHGQPLRPLRDDKASQPGARGNGEVV